MTTEVLMSVPIGPARLEVCAPRLRMGYYKPQPQQEDDGRPLAGVHARVVMGARSVQISSLRDLIQWSDRCGVELRSAVEVNPNSFARFVSFMDIKHYVRVVEIPALYPSAERDFDVDLNRELPRVDDCMLSFVAGRTTFTSQEMWRIRANICTGIVSESAIPRR